MIRGASHTPSIKPGNWSARCSSKSMWHGIDLANQLLETKKMHIYSGKSKDRDLTVSIRSKSSLASWLLCESHPPHNRRRWTIIKRPRLELLNERISRLLVGQVNDFDFEVDHTDMNEIFNKMHKLLSLDQESFRIIP